MEILPLSRAGASALVTVVREIVVTFNVAFDVVVVNAFLEHVLRQPKKSYFLILLYGLNGAEIHDGICRSVDCRCTGVYTAKTRFQLKPSTKTMRLSRDPGQAAASIVQLQRR